ncbi:MAG: TolC family outer membrane protein [Candidatus Berkiella sp.]
MLKRFLFAISMCFCLQAQATLDLEQIYLLALENDPTLKAQADALRANQQALPKAIAVMLPTLSGGYTTTGNNNALVSSNHYNTRNYGLTLTQPIFHPEQWGQVYQAHHIQKQAYALYLASIQDLVIRVSERYFAILGAQDDLLFARGQRKAFARQLEQTQQRFEVGLIPITDVHEAKARHDSAAAREISAENTVANEYEKLREIIKIPVEDIVTYPRTQALDLQAPQPNDQEAWVTTAHVQNLNVVAAHENSKQLKAAIGIQAAGHFPKVDTTASVQRNKSTPPFDNTNLSRSISLNVSIPLFEGGGAYFRTKEASARYDEAQMKLEATQRSADSQTRQSFRGVLTRISEVNALNEAVKSNQSALNATQAAYEVGTRTIVDVLNAESDLLSAVRDHSVSRYNYLLEGLRLKRAAGNLTQDDLFQVNQIIINK